MNHFLLFACAWDFAAKPPESWVCPPLTARQYTENFVLHVWPEIFISREDCAESMFLINWICFIIVQNVCEVYMYVWTIMKHLVSVPHCSSFTVIGRHVSRKKDLKVVLSDCEFDIEPVLLRKVLKRDFLSFMKASPSLSSQWIQIQMRCNRVKLLSDCVVVWRFRGRCLIDLRWDVQTESN